MPYPLLINLKDRQVLIVGGGKVAARKARLLIDSGADQVVCVAYSFCQEMPAGVQKIAGSYDSQLLERAELVFAATDDPAVNDAIVRDAHARNIWVNRADADDDHPGDFTVPAILRRGEVLLAVSAGSPALAAMIRNRLADLFDPRWEAMAEAMRELRPWIRSSAIDISRRRDIFRELASEEALNQLSGHGIVALRQWLLERHPELNHA